MFYFLYLQQQNNTVFIKENTGMFIIFSFQLPPLRSKTRLENKEPTVALTKFSCIFLEKKNRKMFMIKENFLSATAIMGLLHSAMPFGSL